MIVRGMKVRVGILKRNAKILTQLKPTKPSNTKKRAGRKFWEALPNPPNRGIVVHVEWIPNQSVSLPSVSLETQTEEGDNFPTLPFPFYLFGNPNILPLWKPKQEEGDNLPSLALPYHLSHPFPSLSVRHLQSKQYVRVYW
ncbi:hypothetical protein SLEP1_g6559 [Rubroshorea leprosula]|uniref:Uncharacterized protein n=1 Tax=Rubroshorea leprosula TaxID=152421 RepID=A0AAV5I3U4_9ROSI|nr:hypothetical protein SLEP1_g6559 [Rubroshorea leprosula]